MNLYPTAFSCWGIEEETAIRRVIASNRWTMGQEVEAFEREFAAFHGMKHGVMTNSGSSANLLCVSALLHARDLRPDRDKVRVPALAWSTTYAPLVQAGFDLVLVDCDDTWNADWLHSTNEEGYRHRLSVVCSILGNAAEEPHEGRGWVIEDNCESLGAFDAIGRRAGTRALLNTFSFFWSHQISAIEGGMVLTDDSELARLLRIIRAHGWTRDVDKKPRDLDREYEFVAFGYNVRPLELHAAVAREQLKKLPNFVQLRRDNHLFFKEQTAGLGIVHPKETGTSSPFGLPFRLERPQLRQVLVDALRAAGFDCRPPTGGSFTRHPYGRPWRDQKTPNADLIHDAGLFLGNPPWHAFREIEAAVKVLRRVL